MTAPFSLVRFLLVSAAVAVGATALAGCGRKAEPELPRAAGPAETRPVGIPIGPSAPAPEPEKPQKKSFLLDPLL
jgi:predicted small lipoprotein YifL